MLKEVLLLVVVVVVGGYICLPGRWVTLRLAQLFGRGARVVSYGRPGMGFIAKDRRSPPQRFHQTLTNTAAPPSSPFSLWMRRQTGIPLAKSP